MRKSNHDQGEFFSELSLDKFSYRSLLLWVFAFALVLRLIVVVLMFSGLEADPDSYRRIAKGLHATGVYGTIDPQGNGIPTAYRPPMYPWILSFFQGLSNDRTAIAVLHALLGACTVWMTTDIARRLNWSRTRSLLAAALVLLDPILLRQSTLVMTETLATFLGVAIWWTTFVLGPPKRPGIWMPWLQGACLGLALGLACLCRPTSLVWCALWGLIDFRYNRVRAVGIFLGCLITLLPWWLRNRSEMGHGIWTTTHGGYTLLLANNPILYEHWKSSSSRQWDDRRFHVWWATRKANESAKNQTDEIALDSLANRLARETIRQSPWTFLQGCLIRECWLWAWIPSRNQSTLSVRVAIGLWYSIVSLAAIVGLARLLLSNSKELGLWVPALTLAISLCLVHAVYWSNMRMRAPMVPMVSLLAAFSLRRADAVEARSSSDD